MKQNKTTNLLRVNNDEVISSNPQMVKEKHFNINFKKPIVYILIGVITYLCFSFVILEIDFREWPNSDRFTFILILGWIYFNFFYQ
jgi:hypothetical protein